MIAQLWLPREDFFVTGRSIATMRGNNVLADAERWLSGGEQVALATVVATWGSAPCPCGSVMAISHSGRMSGSVSGGCIEVAVTEAAVEMFQSGGPRMLEFGVSNERAWEVGLACGGRLVIFLEEIG